MDKLRKADIYIDENRIPREKLPVFHVTPPCGWMNDPNGFSAYQGKVHLFYQFHPYSEVWGPMHWGHYETKDFIQRESDISESVSCAGRWVKIYEVITKSLNQRRNVTGTF